MKELQLDMKMLQPRDEFASVFARKKINVFRCVIALGPYNTALCSPVVCICLYIIAVVIVIW